MMSFAVINSRWGGAGWALSKGRKKRPEREGRGQLSKRGKTRCSGEFVEGTTLNRKLLKSTRTMKVKENTKRAGAELAERQKRKEGRAKGVWGKSRSYQ